MTFEVLLRRRAIQAAPHEACGFILFDGAVVEVANVAENSMREFRMDRYDVSRRLAGEDFSRIWAVWHTHPNGLTVPSPKDIEAINLGFVQAAWTYLIATAAGVFSYDTKAFVPQDDSFWSEFIA